MIMRSASAIPLLALAVLVAGCASGEAPGQRPAPAPSDAGSADALPSCEAFTEQGLRVRARSVEEFRAELGEPERMDLETAPNRHDPSVTDTIFDLHYPGLRARVHRAGGLRDLLDQVVVRSNVHLLFEEVGIGASEARVIEALGPPADRSANRLLYSCTPGMGPAEPVIFQLREGAVGEIHFTFYVD